MAKTQSCWLCVWHLIWKSWWGILRITTCCYSISSCHQKMTCMITRVIAMWWRQWQWCRFWECPFVVHGLSVAIFWEQDSKGTKGIDSNICSMEKNACIGMQPLLCEYMTILSCTPNFPLAVYLWTWWHVMSVASRRSVTSKGRSLSECTMIKGFSWAHVSFGSINHEQIKGSSNWWLSTWQKSNYPNYFRMPVETDRSL